MKSFPFHKFGLTFRLVEETDAAFILSLRTNTNHARHLSETEDNLSKQIDWIRRYKDREKDGKEYYILFEDESKAATGVVRLYDINHKSYTCGSWLIKPGAETFAALRSDLFVGFFAIEVLQLDNCYFDVRKENKKVLRYHKMFSSVIREDELNVYFLADRASFDKKMDYLKSIIQ